MIPVALSRLLPALLLASPVAAQSVWVVDASGGPGFDFGSIQTAIDTASDGDLILVRAGHYGGIHLVDGKQLVLQAEGVVSLGGLRIRNVASDQYVSVRGFQLLAGEWEFSNNAGPLWFEDVVGPFVPGGGGTLLRFVDCANVVMTGASFHGDLEGGTALLAQDSTLALYDSHFGGGVAETFGLSPRQGPPGVSLRASRIVAMGCTFEGGQGSDPRPELGVPSPGPGGVGAVLRDGSTLEVIDTISVGGPRGGTNPLPLGAPYEVEAGSTLRQRRHAARSMTGGSPLREGQTTPLVFTGEPGDVVHLLVSREPGEWKDYPRRVGPRTLHKILQVIPVGTIPPSGELSIDFTAPPIPGEWHGFFFQPAFLSGRDGALGSFVYGAPTQVHLLDTAF